MRSTPTNREFGRVRQAVLLGLFAGTGIGLGYLLSAVPGVELMSTNAALAGLALGPLGGAVVGMVSQGVYSLASPFGPPVPLMLAAQLLGMAAAGMAGGLLAAPLRRAPGVLSTGLAAVAGLVAALGLDLLTNLAVAVQFSLPLKGVLIGGAAVAALHLGTVAAAWGILLPLLADRLGRLRRPGPRAVLLAGLLCSALVVPRSGVAQELAEPTGDPVAVAAADSAHVASGQPDSLAVAPADTLPGLPEGWRRPLWRPFHGTFAERLARITSWLPVRDGGPGATMVVLGEASTSPVPEIWRDGMPLGVGHRFLDDPESWSLAGRDLEVAPVGSWPAARESSVLVLAPRDPVPDRDLLDTYWFAGPHETRLRDVQFLTADAVWRLSVDAYENLDREGYDFRTPGESRFIALDNLNSTEFWGNAAVRSTRGRLSRRLEDGSRVTIALENSRKHKHGVAVSDLDQQEIWRNSTQLRWQAGGRDDRSEATVWWTDTDLLVDPIGGGDRLIEGAREGARVSWAPPGALVDLDLTYQRWAVQDSGADSAWAPAYADTSRIAGEDLALTASRRWQGRIPITGAVGARWAQHGGASATAVLTAGGPRGWGASAARSGRAPRSDELATAWRYVVPGGRQTVVLPSIDLERERQWRVAMGWSGALGGLDVALDTSWLRLRHGIGWDASVADTEVGRLTNGVALDAAAVTARIGGAGRFLGWLRWQAEGTWQSLQQDDDLQLALPPTLQYRLSAVWEQRFFEEDGITQLAAYWHNRGAMDDPWAWSRPVELAAISSLDVIAGFRLVGTNLSMEMRNLLGGESRLTANAVSEPREFRWRLHWTFHH